MRLLIMGPPGSGKGTQATLIKQAYQIPHISTGEMFRAAIQTGSALGVEAKKYIDHGELVPDDITIEIVKNRITEKDCHHGFLLDGFPRTLPQAVFLDCLLEKCQLQLDAVLNLEMDEEALVKRILGRRVCSNCGATYHVESIPSQVAGICDVCGGKLVMRKDDTEETIRLRLRIYRENTYPLLEYYAKKDLIKTVDGSCDIQTSFQAVVQILGGINDHHKK